MCTIVHFLDRHIKSQTIVAFILSNMVYLHLSLCDL
jgi:hypothetical protein